MLRSKLPVYYDHYTENEVNLIRDSFNGIEISDGLPVQDQLYTGVNTSIQLDGLDKKWGVDAHALLDKLAHEREEVAQQITTNLREWWNTPNPHWDISRE